ncbi:uncharacterized protein si:ch211-63p21.1 isoform X2 [Hypanus sabinus]|uniref:uncharacterized protein si:ch211-63p21.1 isoform X2 n=1 Tax=Hypanus sabinus TaxID=79690 RepID=UPI0028C3AF61|nr:uncharacterized protein si:ch211-63p21.1 isoform X2 [Hypanus sabinus]
MLLYLSPSTAVLTERARKQGPPAMEVAGTREPTTDPEWDPRDRLSGSDGDADVEDADGRLRASELPHRCSSRRRRRPRLVQQDTTESEDDSTRNRHGQHHCNVPLSPQHTSQAITEESVSQIRPLVLSTAGLRPSGVGVSLGPEIQTPALHCPMAPRDNVSCLFVTSIVFIPLGLLLLLCLLQRKEA